MPSIRSVVVGCIALAACAAGAARAATPLSALRFAPDITVSLGGTTISPAGVAEDDLAGTVVALDVGNIPADAHVDAYELRPGGGQLLSFDTTVSLPGNVVVGPADVVLYDGAAYTLIFDGAGNGVPEGVNVDGFAEGPGATLFLSFDTSVFLNNTTFEDEDIVQLNHETIVPLFVGADAGVPADLDLDGFALIAPQRLLLSFDGSGRIAGVDFDDDDVLEYDAAGDTWELAYSGTDNYAGWAAADLVALFGLPAEPTPTPTQTEGPSPTATPTSETPVGGTATATPTGGVTTPATVTATPVVTASVSPTITPIGFCNADCNGDDQVTIDELITVVQIALGHASVADCLDADTNDDGAIGIDEIVAAVARAQSGC